MQEGKYKTCYLFYTSLYDLNLKQDLNVLSNFADNLNARKSPSVSKSSTFDIIADNFSSFDNNFLKLNSFEQPFISKSSNSDSISMSTSFNKSIP